MSRAMTIAAIGVCALSLTAGPRRCVADSDAPAPSTSRAIALEVLIVGTVGDAKGEQVAEFSGPSEEVAQRLGKLEADGRIAVMDRIRLTVLENQKAMVQVGRTAPVVSGRSFVARGGQPQVAYQQQNVGTLMSATARVDGDAIVVELQVEKSQLEQPAETPESDEGFTPTGTGMLSSQATVRIENGKTVLAGGMESRAGGKSSGQLVLASARLLDASAIAVPPKSDESPSRAAPQPPSDETAGIGQWLKTGSWVTLTNDQGGYRVRVMTAEQKARAEEAIGEYEEQMAKYREFVMSSRQRGADPNAEPPTPVEMPRLAADLRNRRFLQVVSLAGDFVELKGDDIHAIVPLASIRLILLGEAGDVPSAPIRSRPSALGAGNPVGSRGSQ